MVLLHDTQIRVAVLHYIAAQLGEGDPGELLEAGLEVQQLADLRELSAFNLRRLAATRQLRIAVSVDGRELTGVLRNLAGSGDAKTLEVYFLRHGASCRMMHALFKMGRKTTLKRRRQWGVRQPSGTVRLPPLYARLKIIKAWRATPEMNPRLRYFHLHQLFPYCRIAALEKVILLLAPQR
jgi:hypothetical protein